MSDIKNWNKRLDRKSEETFTTPTRSLHLKKMSVNWINQAQEIMARSCEYGNAPSVSIKLRYFLEYANVF